MNDRHKNRKAHNRKELTGQRFGKLLVLREAGHRSNKSLLWLCRCDCGNEKSILAKYLLCGDTKSCGCLLKDGAYNRDVVGGITKSFWTPIIKQAARRGIPFEVTREVAWNLFCKQNGQCALSGIELSFAMNIRDERNTHTASLDRVDSNKGYVPDNIQWIHKQINIMKNKLSDAELLEWCKLIVKNNPDKARPSVGRLLPVVHTPR